MQFVQFFLITILAHKISCQLPSYPKQTIMIGGYSAGTSQQFLQKWAPLFQTYLTEEVGSLYAPAITFTLIPVDFTPDTTSQKLVSAGLLDFVCAYQLKYCKTRLLSFNTARPQFLQSMLVEQ